MIKFSNKEYGEMNETLQGIATEAENNLQRAERSYHAVQASIQRLKEFILGYSFKDKQEEVHFFKEIKPMFYSQLIYYNKIFYLEANKPVGTDLAQKEYYSKKLERIAAFFTREHEFYTYYRIGKTEFDEQLFVRESSIFPLFPDEYVTEADPRFCTIHSYKVSKIQAYEKLGEYIQHNLHRLAHREISDDPNQNNKSLWTDSKAALIELAYAIHARGSVNNGKGDVKTIISNLELIFNVEVGNFYRTFQSMRIRKKNRTAYLDTLKESLERRMDETDLDFS